MESGWTPLELAVWVGAWRIVTYLLEQPGILIDCRGDENQTPLLLSARCGNPKMTRLLLEKGADRWLKNSKGEDALEIARQAFKRYLENYKGADAKNFLESIPPYPELIDRYERTIAILEEAMKKEER